MPQTSEQRCWILCRVSTKAQSLLLVNPTISALPGAVTAVVGIFMYSDTVFRPVFLFFSRHPAPLRALVGQETSEKGLIYLVMKLVAPPPSAYVRLYL